ncbi:MAG TPA: hypothetical protein DEB39_11060 [Planctomycetaceae bacterium]|nr:hypothetical protein [Planctomycetaceae bacterium]
MYLPDHVSDHRMKILLFGMVRPEFEPVVRDLKRVGTVEHRDEPERFYEQCVAAGAVSAPPSYDLVVFLQSFSREFAKRTVECWRRFDPLVSILLVQGTWCEGTGRTETPFPGVLRLYGHQWPGRGRDELLALGGGRLACSSLCSTSGEEDYVLLENDRVCGRHPVSCHDDTLLIIEEETLGTDFAFNDLLLDIFLHEGIRARIGPLSDVGEATRRIALGLGDGVRKSRGEHIRSVSRRFPDRHILAFLDSPRWEEMRIDPEAHHVTVVPKLFRFKDLNRILGRFSLPSQFDDLGRSDLD